jgi:hypothetical protein
LVDGLTVGFNGYGWDNIIHGLAELIKAAVVVGATSVLACFVVDLTEKEIVLVPPLGTLWVNALGLGPGW